MLLISVKADKFNVLLRCLHSVSLVVEWKIHHRAVHVDIAVLGLHSEAPTVASQTSPELLQ